MTVWYGKKADYKLFWNGKVSELCINPFILFQGIFRNNPVLGNLNCIGRKIVQGRGRNLKYQKTDTVFPASL